MKRTNLGDFGRPKFFGESIRYILGSFGYVSDICTS